MKIAALDTYTTDFDGISWTPFAALGDFTHYPRTRPADVIERCEGCAAMIINKIVVTDNLMQSLPQLRYIGITATGTNNVDLHAAARRSIAVTNVPNYSSDSVAQTVFGYILNRATRIADYDALTQKGAWNNSADFCLPHFTTCELAGKTIGIIGCGSIGKRVAQIAEVFGMQVLAAAVPGRQPVPDRLPLEYVLANSDYITLHCPLTPATEGLINRDRIELMKPTVMLINTARGGVIDEPALADALRSGRIACAALDVLSTEPPTGGNPLLKTPNALITPHIAWSAKEARVRLISEAAANLAAFANGELKNRVEQVYYQ